MEEITITTDNSHISSEKMIAIKASPKLHKFLGKNNPQKITVKNIKIHSVDFFGPVHPDKVGFLKISADAIDAHTGIPIPSIAFIRGDSVAILIIVTILETGKKYVLMCEQLRFPTG